MMSGLCRLVLLDTPPGTRILLDFYEWTCGEHFLGVRSMPCGAHLCVVLQSSAPTRFWAVLGDGSTDASVHVRRWSKESEEFVLLPADDERRMTESALRCELDNRLGAYVDQEDRRPNWQSCTSALQRLSGSSVFFSVATALAWNGRGQRSRVFDRSQELESIGPELVLAWLQRAYLEMVLAHDAEAFDVWRDGVVLFCGCVRAVRERPGLFVEVCRTLEWQFAEAGGEVLWEEGGGKTKNMLVAALAQLVEDVVSDPETDAQLRAAALRLRHIVPAAELDDEDGPAIVEEDMI